MARGLSSWVVDGSSSVAHVIGHLADRKVQSWSGRTALSVDAWLPMSARFNIHSKLFKDEVEGVRPGRLTPVVSTTAKFSCIVSMERNALHLVLPIYKFHGRLSQKSRAC
jgi:hypothetical protein